MDVIDFDKPEENKVDFFEEIGPSAADLSFKAPVKIELPSGASQTSEKVAQNPDTSQPSENSKDLSPEQKVLETVGNYLKEGRDFGIAADFDENIASYSTIDPEIRQAFIDMIAAGKEVVIISSRGARDVAERVNIPGISIIGTLGWETLDKNGKSHINERFKPFQPQITGILRHVREKFLTEQLGRQAEVVDEPNIKLETSEGQNINLQKKGYNEEYPEGINSTWALSELPQEAQDKYKDALKRYYNEAFAKHTASMTENDLEAFKELCGFRLREGKGSDGERTLDVEIGPMSQITKAKASIQLMREPGDPKRQKHFEDMPYHSAWVYSGDHEQDFPVMRLGDTANVLTKGKRNITGIWSKPLHEEERAVRGVDAVVNGVSGNRDLMIKIANKVKLHFATPKP